MHELLGILETDFNGKIIKVLYIFEFILTYQCTGDFEKKEQNELNEFIKNFLYILQDAISIKSKLNNSGNFIKVRMRNDKTQFEAAIGASYIRINKYNPE